MNGYNNTDNRKTDANIDLVDVDFSRNREMDIIRQNEEIERERRRRIAARIRRREMIRQRKIERIKRLVLAWSVLVFGLIIFIALIMGVVSLFKNKDDKTENLPKNAVSSEQTQLVDAFVESENNIYSLENVKNTYQKMNDMIISYNLSEDEAFSYNSLLKYYAKAFSSGSLEIKETVKKAIRDCAMYSNGYIWSQEKTMKFEKTNSYMYDTNASFISAVAEICRWENSTDFLSQIDVNVQPNKDFSGGMTVSQKFEKALLYFFDEDDINGGGIRYNKDDGLVYILTKDNDATQNGRASNIFFNYRFGYLDLYNNLLFYEAMNDASFVYTQKGDQVNAKKYLEIAKKNKDAINKTFFKDTRYIGCIDEDKNTYDYGFTALNLYAISSGVADKNKTEKILSWINGNTKVNTDTVDSADIYKLKSKPAFTTIQANESWWVDTTNEQTGDENKYAFGNYWQNGAGSYLAGAFGITVAEKQGDDKLNQLLEAYCSEFENGEFDIKKDTTDEFEIFKIYALQTALNSKFGISTLENALCVKPTGAIEGVTGIKNIAFSGNNYGFMFDNGEVYVTALYEGAVNLKIYGFEKAQQLSLVTVKDGIAELTESITADDNGCVSLSKLFGKNTYLKIEKLNQNKK